MSASNSAVARDRAEFTARGADAELHLERRRRQLQRERDRCRCRRGCAARSSARSASTDATDGSAGQPARPARSSSSRYMRVEQLDRDEAEVHRAAGGVEDRDLARELTRARAARPLDEPRQLDPRIGMHLEPQLAERVVQEELDDPPRREELRDGGDVVVRELPPVAPRGAVGGFERGGVDGLVDPAEGVVVAEDARRTMSLPSSRVASGSLRCGKVAQRAHRGRARAEQRPRAWYSARICATNW